jgi:hypothetical protein
MLTEERSDEISKRGLEFIWYDPKENAVGRANLKKEGSYRKS